MKLRDYQEDCLKQIEKKHNEGIHRQMVVLPTGAGKEVVHSQVPLEEREQGLKDFEQGKIQFIANPLILTEGYDCPRADCMINVAPTQNRSLYI